MVCVVVGRRCVVVSSICTGVHARHSHQHYSKIRDSNFIQEMMTNVGEWKGQCSKCIVQL